ncbi:MAG TPA: DUF2339 domain-containing protein [Rhodocyclaceae bacterium]|nr:DUF2339 domain-containing protein [Rhodocyclaceae bacterium]
MTRSKRERGQAMWLGIVLGLMLGAAFQSFTAAMLLGVIGAVIGGAMTQRKAPEGAAKEDIGELRTRVLDLERQLRLATQRLDRLEGRVAPAEAPAPLPDLESAPAQALSEDELARQALAAGEMPLEQELLPEDLPEIVTAAVLEEEKPPAAEPPPAPEAVAPPPVEPELPPQPESLRPPPQIAPEPEPAEPDWFSTFVSRWVLGGNPIVKVGVLILFLGLAFLLRYVAENTVVPIGLRYAGVALAGIGLLGAGWRWRGREGNYGLILQGAGVGVLYLTTLAGMKLHPLIPPELGFVVLIGVAAFAALLAILEDALPLAVAASLGGFAAPVLASTGSEHHLAFFGYLTILNLGIAAIAWFKAWRILNLIGFISTFFLAAAWGDRYYQPALFGLAEPFLLLFFVVYVLITFLYARRTLGEAEEAGEDFSSHVRRALPRVGYVDGSLAFGVPMAAFGMQYLITRSFENGPAYSALGFGLLYIVLAFVLFRRTGLRYALLNETMIALAVIFGSLALPLGLEGEWTSAGWAVEAAGVYWVGVRQGRVYARLFALLLLFGSAAYFALDLGEGSGEAVLDGSRLGCLVLAVALGWTYRLLRRAEPAGLSSFEPGLRPWLAGAAAFFVGLAPFLLWAMNWAATALALVGTAVLFAARRLSERALVGVGCLFQLAAGGLFLTTVQRGDGGAALADGWHGLFAAGVIGGAMLAGAVAALRGSRNKAGEEDVEGLNGWLLSPVLLAGLAFVNLAPLFILPWRLAALVWPLTALATLAWAVRAGQPVALGFALILQLVAGGVVLNGRTDFWIDAALAGNPVRAFLHSGFWGPLLISLAALAGARFLQRDEGDRKMAVLGWASLLWSMAWWAFGWSGEIRRLLPAETAIAALVAVAVLTMAFWLWLERRLAWAQIGQATLVYLPALAILLGDELLGGTPHPLSGWNAAAWPLALFMHVRLLRAQEDELAPKLQWAAHLAGAWFFLLLASLEVHWHIDGLGGHGGAWSWFGWLPVALLFAWLVSDSRLRGRWPLSVQAETYAVHAASPLVFLIIAWGAVGNFQGEGAPSLPYVPLLNPVELGQVGILFTVARWWSGLRTHPLFSRSGPLMIGVLGASAFAMLSAAVLRACHHWGGVAWEGDALAHSMLAQASLSIVWSLVAIGLMLFAHRRGLRFLWLGGAGLVGLVVAKLFLVELAASGSLERIVSFIVVGLLLLLVGYFAPLPPRRDDPEPLPAQSAP